jgi:hypothetical protein
MPEDLTGDDDDDDVFTCWCGAKGRYEDLCDESGLDFDCGGTGHMHVSCEPGCSIPILAISGGYQAGWPSPVRRRWDTSLQTFGNKEGLGLRGFAGG